MSSSEIVIIWAFENLFKGVSKMTRSIHSCLRATITVLAGIEVSLSGSMHASLKWILMRDKIVEQCKAFCSKHMKENKIDIPTFMNPQILCFTDLNMKKPWSVSTTTETTWKSYQTEIKAFKNHILPLWVGLLKQYGRNKDDSLKIPSGKSLIELLDRFAHAVHLSELKGKDKGVTIEDKVAEELGGSAVHSNEFNRKLNDINDTIEDNVEEDNDINDTIEDNDNIAEGYDYIL
jgi:hypothetical protein